MTDKEKVEEFLLDGLHACNTGDCPHESVRDCLADAFLAGKAEAKEREEKLRQLTNEVSDLRAALQCYKDHMAQGAKLIGWVAP